MNAAAPTAASVYPPLPIGEAAPGSRKLRVCIASFDFVGPVKNGGVGTAFTSLGEALATAGHDVTLLYVSGQWCENGTLEHWIEYYKHKNIRFVPMPVTCTLKIAWSWQIVQGYQAYLWLKAQSFDVVHFSEWNGPGYFSLLAKHQGLAFARTLFCVHTHGPTLWHKLSNSEWVNSCEDLERDYVERASVRLADVVASPSQYLLGWMKEQGWQLPEKCFVQQYVRPATARKTLPVSGDGIHRPGELVFFGRLEHRKGLALFCDALDRLVSDRDAAPLAITFLGKSAEMGLKKSTEYISDRAVNWPWKWQVLSDRDQAGAMDYLQGPGRVAVIPSLVDNLPNTVLECLGAGLPFIASNAGGIPEMIAAEDLSATCFELRPAALAAKIKHIARQGLKAPRQAIDSESTERAWVAWHESTASALPATAAPSGQPASATNPLVSVCIAHWNRPHYLQQAIASIEAQDYKNIEVVVVDDCSTSPEAIAYLGKITRLFEQKDWQVLRQPENRFPGAARNRAVQAARGEYIFFMDDDNVAKPHELSTFVAVARKTGADVLTCFLDTFDGVDAPTVEQKITSRRIFLGDCVSSGALRNTFGDTNSLVRRSVFLELGGFHEQWGVNHEDYEFMAKVILRGFKLEVIPEALVWYRMNEGENSVLRSTPRHGNLMCSIRPFLDAVPPELRNLILLAQGMSMRPADHISEATINSYVQSSMLWRSKLEAGLTLAGLGQAQAAVKLYLEAVKAVETCRAPKMVLEALMEIAPALGRFDPGRARYLLGIADETAAKLQNATARQKIGEALTKLPKGAVKNSVSAAKPQGPVLAK